MTLYRRLGDGAIRILAGRDIGFCQQAHVMETGGQSQGQERSLREAETPTRLDRDATDALAVLPRTRHHAVEHADQSLGNLFQHLLRLVVVRKFLSGERKSEG